MANEHFLTVKQVAERLNVTPLTVQVKIKTGGLKAFKMPHGKAWLIREQDLQVWLNSDV